MQTIQIQNSVKNEHPNLTNTILQGDCIEVMRQTPANSVDLGLPPWLTQTDKTLFAVR